MPLDDFVDRARALRKQGCDDSQITTMLQQYGATANEADRALKELQKEERRNRPRDQCH
jgi:hypothetical protein